MKQSDPQFKLRLPGDLKHRLELAAETKGRTLTTEIIDRLESTFSPQRELFTKEHLEQLVTEVVDQRIGVELERMRKGDAGFVAKKRSR